MTACHASRPWWRSWIMWRRVVQVFALAGFLVLVWRGNTIQNRDFSISPLSSFIFWCDPLVSFAALAAGSLVAATLIGGLVAVLVALLFGRAFCGWLCPLGTLLDVARRMWSPILSFHMQVAQRTKRVLRGKSRISGTANKPPGQPTRERSITGRIQHRLGQRGWAASGPLVVLIVVVIALPLGLPLLGFVEPFALLERALATALIPWSSSAAHVASAWFQPAVDHIPAPGPLEDFRFLGAPLRSTSVAFAGAGLCAGLLILLLLAEAVQPRWWCRTLCPTGAVLGLVSRWSLVMRLPLTTCGTCSACARTCHLGAFDAQERVIPAACTACMRCVEDCPQDIATFGRSTKVAAVPVDLSRRGFLIASVAGAALPFLPGLRATSADPFRLRPPGVAAMGEPHFLDACVRCGACVRACPTHGLQPVLLADGVGGVFAPRLVPRLGACEHGCTACAQVCPTGAIPLLELREKKTTALGVAIHDHQRCLPWAVGAECRACQEHCPVADKAIVLKMGRSPDGGTVPLPSVVAERCIGCGTCEFVCPIEGEAGIRVATRDAADALRPRLQPVTVPR